MQFFVPAAFTLTLSYLLTQLLVTSFFVKRFNSEGRDGLSTEMSWVRLSSCNEPQQLAHIYLPHTTPRTSGARCGILWCCKNVILPINLVKICNRIKSNLFTE